MQKLLILLWAGFITLATGVQDLSQLKKSIEQKIEGRNGMVGVAITGTRPNDTLTINGCQRFPMQSVFKFPIVAAVLKEIDKGHLSIDQKIEIKKSELLPGLWSPIREKYPEGAALELSEIMFYTVSLSDNVGCDVLLRLIGGPQFVETFLKENGLHEISIKINEETMQNNWGLQFLNWITPRESNNLIRLFYDNEGGLLSADSYRFLWNKMRETETGQKRLKGRLPDGTVVAHKTGWSGQNKETGITAAVNDIGVVFLPGGDHFFISVFITDSKDDTDVNERLIADIARLVWEYFLQR